MCFYQWLLSMVGFLLVIDASFKRIEPQVKEQKSSIDGKIYPYPLLAEPKMFC